MKASSSLSVLATMLALTFLNLASSAPTALPSDSVSASGASFFYPLSSLPASEFIIPNRSGPQRWSCTYMNTQVQASSRGTAISIGQGSSSKPFSCGEMILKKTPQYGTYSIDMISSNVRGVVTGFFLITTGGMATEIDIEMTGLNSKVLHLNVWKDGTQHPIQVPLEFDASQDWHNYALEWRKDYIAWFVDGKQVLKRSDIPTENPHSSNYRLAMNSWTDSNDDRWAGKFAWPSEEMTKVESRFRNLKYTP
ncbi:hypothetical protein BGZ58_009919 [Dissophora ornata]|nr:hypothetical protein BGZ58_009919 [Dissophora ornata]